MTDQAIVVQDEVRLGGLQVSGPGDVIHQASMIATELAKIVEGRKLYSIISGKKFPRVEAWTTMGAMLGITPREVEVLSHEDGTYEAVVELVRNSDGFIVGRGSAICGMDEKTWSSRPAYARRSMSITRATGKAFRLSFSWIMTLSGYEPTPAEEMSDVVEGEIVDEEKPKKNGNGGKGKSWTEEFVNALIKSKVAENPKHAVNVLNLLQPSTIVEAEKWGKLYRAWRDSGEEENMAAEKAIKGEAPK